jgi:hypothetical protein
MDKASETLLSLKPVTFRYKKEIDPARALSFGLIAEEVAEINPDLITRDEKGQPQTVRYEAVNAMLLNEFLKEHRRVQKLEMEIAKQREEFRAATQEHEKEIKALTAVVREQASEIEKVSPQLEVRNPVLQTALKNQ